MPTSTRLLLRRHPAAPVTPHDEPDAPMVQEVRQRLKPLLALFGGVAALTTFLLYVGFLSDYGAFRMAGLPRLQFSITALAEAGAETLIDMLALVANGTRVVMLLLMLAGLIWLWGGKPHPWMLRLLRAWPLQRACWLALLVVVGMTFGGLVTRVQRSLNGDMYGHVAVSRALTQAYDGNAFPSPRERQAALDAEGYQFPRPVGWLLQAGVATERGWRQVQQKRQADPVDMDENLSGVVLRPMPEARHDARHTFGWLLLVLMGLAGAALALLTWGCLLRARAARRTGRPAPPARGWLRRLAWAGPALEPVVRHLVTPLTLALLTLCALLLPLAHGLLAKRSLGGEAVMVYLKTTPVSVKLTDKAMPVADAASQATLAPALRALTQREHTLPGDEVHPGGDPPVRFACPSATLAHMQKPIRAHDQALRDLAQTRPTAEDPYAEKQEAYAKAVDALAQATIAAQCGEAMQLMWTSKPALGLAAVAPEVADTYRRALLRVTQSYQVQVGTILTYPRDRQPLLLVNEVVPRHLDRAPVWSVVGLDASQTGEVLVVPGQTDRMRVIARLVDVKSDAGRTEELLALPSAKALQELLRLLNDQRLLPYARGPAVTALGSMVWAGAAERPDLAADAIDLLAKLAGTEPSPLFPAKDDDLRGAALTALHLTRNPYAAYRLAKLVDGAGGYAICGRPAGGEPTPTHCLGGWLTSAGYALQDLRLEEWRLQGQASNGPMATAATSAASAAPDQSTHLSQLQIARQQLSKALAVAIVDPQIDEVRRSAACNIVDEAAGFALAPAQWPAFLRLLEPEPERVAAFDYAACLMNAAYMGLPDAPLRRALHQVVLDGGDDHRLPEQVRPTITLVAWRALSGMGLAHETPFAMQALLQSVEGSPVEMTVLVNLNEIQAQPLADALYACATEAQAAGSRRARCLRAFGYLNPNYNGDQDNMAQRIRPLLDASDPTIRKAACATLTVFRNRGGWWVPRTENQDPALRSCITSRAKLARQVEDAKRRIRAAADHAGTAARQKTP